MKYYKRLENSNYYESNRLNILKRRRKHYLKNKEAILLKRRERYAQSKIKVINYD